MTIQFIFDANPNPRFRPNSVVLTLREGSIPSRPQAGSFPVGNVRVLDTGQQAIDGSTPSKILSIIKVQLKRLYPDIRFSGGNEISTIIDSRKHKPEIINFLLTNLRNVNFTPGTRTDEVTTIGSKGGTDITPIEERAAGAIDFREKQAAKGQIIGVLNPFIGDGGIFTPTKGIPESGELGGVPITGAAATIAILKQGQGVKLTTAEQKALDLATPNGNGNGKGKGGLGVLLVLGLGIAALSGNRK